MKLFYSTRRFSKQEAFEAQFNDEGTKIEIILALQEHIIKKQAGKIQAS